MVSWLDFLLPQNTGLNPQQLNDIDTRGLLQASALLANMSAPHAGAYKATPLQLITNGLNAYQQGAQGGVDQFYNNNLNQAKSAAAEVSTAADKQNLDWIKNNPISAYPYASGIQSPTVTPSNGITLNDFYKDPITAAQIKIESGGNPNAVSPKGAFGLMQLMPGTARDPGFGVKPMQNNTPAENVRVGEEYTQALMKKYNDPQLALMAYNWGPGNVDNWLASGARPEAVPEETRNYVQQVIQNSQGSQAQPVTPSNDNTRFANHLYQIAEMQMRTNRPGAESLLKVASMYDPNLRRINNQGIPAVIQIADEMAAARASGNKQRLADIAAIGKFYDKGVLPGEDGKFGTLPNYADAVGNIAGVKKEYEKRAESKVSTESDINKQLQDLQDFTQSVGRFKEALSQTGMTGPVAGRIGDVTADAGRINLVSAQNELVLRAKSMLGMPNANFSDQDRKFIEAIAGGNFGSKEGLSRVAERLENMAAQQALGLVQRKNSLINSTQPTPTVPTGGSIKFLGFE